jgi:NAD(P)H-quinone oxidoreductase subunit 5
MTPSVPLALLVLVGVAAPAVLLALLGGASLVNRPLPERWTSALAATAMIVAFVAFAIALVVYGPTGGTHVLSFGAWSTARAGGVAIEFLVDRLSLAFAALTTAIVGVVSAFSNRYLHREPGYNRYFVLLAMFVAGMLLIALAGNVTVLLVGWEFVGLSSALLVAFFHERSAAVSNAFRVLSVYRLTDAAMLSAAVWLHHIAGSGSVTLLFGTSVAGPPAVLGGGNTTIVALLLLIAVAGKSALLPFSGWLPRAMEGPTPSSAVYYGSLSIHAGCFLLLRAAPLFEQAIAARIVAGGLGVVTAIFAGMTTRVQSDVKSSLAYASLTQVGIIVVEIALGLQTIALLHLTGHACFRLLQFLTAPNVLHDLHGLADVIGDHHRPSRRAYLEGLASEDLRRRLFLCSLERGFLDTILDRFIVHPFVRVADRLANLDRWLCDAVLPRARRVHGMEAEDRDE